MQQNTSVTGHDALLGTTVAGRYRVDAVIDQGAMGRVYSATHIAMRKRVALKVLRPELTRVPEVMERFAREARAAAHISHPNVAAATDFGELPDGSVFLVLEFVEGITLRSVIEHGALPIRRALEIVRQVALALQAAHALSIVHRDLKPENVMLVRREEGDDFVKVLDFGVAKVPIDFTGNPDTNDGTGGTPITKAGMVFGTPDYMSVEQALGQPVDGRADLYSLGVIAYEMITGRRPFRSNHEFGVIGQQLTGMAPAMSRRAPWLQVPRDVDAFVAKLLQTDVTKRTASAEDVLATINTLLKTLPHDLPDPVAPTAEQLDAVEASLTEPEGTPRPATARSPRSEPSTRGLAALHAHLPEPLNLIPLWVYLAVGAVFLLGGFGIAAGFLLEHNSLKIDQSELAAHDPDRRVRLPAAATVRSADDSGAAGREPAAEAELSAEQSSELAQLTEARGAGPLAVKALLERYPENGWIRVQLARELVKERNYREANKWVAEAVRIDPALIGDKYLAGVLWFTAQHRETRDETLKLLTGDMLAAGADIMYDLAVTPGVSDEVAASARAWVSSPEFQAAASVEARIAGALLLAQTCSDVSALLERAQREGDKRALLRLKQFDFSAECSAPQADCALCAQSGRALTETVARLQARVAEQRTE